MRGQRGSLVLELDFLRAAFLLSFLTDVHLSVPSPLPAPSLFLNFCFRLGAFGDWSVPCLRQMVPTKPKSTSKGRGNWSMGFYDGVKRVTLDLVKSSRWYR